MYFKLALGNIKKSFKDYTIYFLTLVLGICLFYSFNSIDSQEALAELKASKENYISSLMNFMAFVSVLVSIILGSLILYANNFLIKKRKKELGIYMTLGMAKSKISWILVTETFIVGVISLIVGLILGIAAAQGLSAFTLKLFNIAMQKYKFAVSPSAVAKSIIYFEIIFLLVIIFNVFIISKYKVIDLLTASRKNEKLKINNPIICVPAFILCVISLGFGYSSIIKIGLDFENSMFLPSIAIILLGTVLFFFSLAGFLLYSVKKSKKVYFKGLNIFIAKQINYKVNTNFVSMSLICLMLFITIGVLSAALSYKRADEEVLKKIVPFDASLILYNIDEENGNTEDVLNKINIKTSKNESCAVYNIYPSGIRVSDLFVTGEKGFRDVGTIFIKISDYNKMLKLRGKKEMKLSENEVLILSDYNKIARPANEKLKYTDKINISGKEYLIKNHKAIEDNLYNFVTPNNYFTIVINDGFLEDYKISTTVINVVYLDGNREENNKKYRAIAEKFVNRGNKDSNSSINIFLKDDIYNENNAIKALVLFIAIYMGIVFLITSMAVLALQQLSEASDSIERYKALRRIGANPKMIDKTIFIQILIYFSLPVILALIHSIIGIIVVNKEISTFNEIDIRVPALITALIFIVIYAGYFYTTYTGYKNIVKNSI